LLITNDNKMLCTSISTGDRQLCIIYKADYYVLKTPSSVQQRVEFVHGKHED